jgi:hypothetical protein
MTDQSSPADTPQPTHSPHVVQWGGFGLIIAGVLQLVAVIRFLVPAAPEWITPLWQIVGWLLGAVILLATSIVLASGRHGRVGITGRSRLGRAASSSLGPAGSSTSR